MWHLQFLLWTGSVTVIIVTLLLLLWLLKKPGEKHLSRNWDTLLSFYWLTCFVLLHCCLIEKEEQREVRFTSMLMVSMNYHWFINDTMCYWSSSSGVPFTTVFAESTTRRNETSIHWSVNDVVNPALCGWNPSNTTIIHQSPHQIKMKFLFAKVQRTSAGTSNPQFHHNFFIINCFLTQGRPLRWNQTSRLAERRWACRTGPPSRCQHCRTWTSESSSGTARGQRHQNQPLGPGALLTSAS